MTTIIGGSYENRLILTTSHHETALLLSLAASTTMITRVRTVSVLFSPRLLDCCMRLFAILVTSRQLF